MTPKEAQVLADHLRDVLPEADAADVAKWAANPGAVRDLLARARYVEARYDGDESCCDCGAYAEDSHGRTQLMDSPGKPWRDCVIAAAWRALGDPRGAADIERAHEEAKAEQERRARNGRNVTAGRVGEWVDASRANPFMRLLCTKGATEQGFHPCSLLAGHTEPCEDTRLTARTHFPDGSPRSSPCDCAACARDRAPFRLASESQQAARGRLQLAVRADQERTRQSSDARGMEAVEAEAWGMNGGVAWAREQPAITG